jgi:Tfp pilus assembly protein PilN
VKPVGELDAGDRHVGKNAKGSRMYYWPLNDAHLVLLVLACVAVIIIGSIVTALTTVRRAEFSRLQNEVKQLSMMQNEVKRLSKKIKALEADEERRFLMELNNPKSNGAEPLGSYSSVTTAHG